MNKTMITLLSALLFSHTATAEVLCKVVDYRDVEKCAVGDTLYYRTDSITGARNPIEFAAEYCDINKPIVVRARSSDVLCVVAGRKEVKNTNTIFYRKKKDSDSEKVKK